MANDLNPDDLRNLWRDQPLENQRMPLDEIRARASRFERRISRRNLREYAGGLLAVAIYGFSIWKQHNPVMRAGSAMVIAGVLFVMWQLYRRGGASQLPADLGFLASLELHRRQLIQQRDLLRTVFRWYIAPIIPGLIVVVIASVPGRFELRYLPRMAPFLGILMGTLVAIWWLNRRAALKLERQIAELDNLERQS